MRPSATPSLADILAWGKSGSLAPDEGAMKEAKAQQAAFDMNALLFKRVFDAEDGRKVLEVLADASVRRASVNHTLTGADYLAYAQLRQGQDQLFATILAYLDHADTLETTNARTLDSGPGRSPGSGAGSSGGSGPGPGPGGGAGWNDSAFGDGAGGGDGSADDGGDDRDTGPSLSVR